MVQTFEDLRVEKEVQIRKRISRMYGTALACYGSEHRHMEYLMTLCCLFRFNKRLEDFRGDLEAYNAYLEQVEETSRSLATADSQLPFLNENSVFNAHPIRLVSVQPRQRC